MQQVLEELTKSIDALSEDQVSITESDWLMLANSWSATIPHKNDKYFHEVLTHPWGLDWGFSKERINEMEKILFEKIRQKTTPKEDEGKVL